MRRTATIAALTALACTGALTGCSSVDSREIRTGGVKAHVTVWVTDDAGDAEVAAGLTVGTLTFVDLNDGEKLTAKAGDVSDDLERRHLAGATDYHGRLSGVTEPGTEVVVGWSRTSNDDSAPRSVVTLAERVSMTAPASGTAFSRKRDDIVVKLETKDTDEATVLTWTGACIATGSRDVPRGERTVRIPRGTIQRSTTTPSTGSVDDDCRAYLTVTRRRAGHVDSAFDGGQIVAESRSTRQIMSRP
jgi:hypothetical protein